MFLGNIKYNDHDEAHTVLALESGDGWFIGV